MIKKLATLFIVLVAIAHIGFLILGVNVVDNPDLALKENLALFILVHGFKTGTFTGRKITDFIDSSKTDFINARRNINGTDHAHDIADFAKQFLAGL